MIKAIQKGAHVPRLEATVNVTGVLFSAPLMCANRKGERFVTATLRLKEGASITWWRVVVFTESVQNDFVSMNIGNIVSVRGRLRAEVYKINTLTPNIALSVVADSVALISASVNDGGKRNNL
jgi:single-stranded DNA-binding protein